MYTVYTLNINMVVHEAAGRLPARARNKQE